MHLDVVGVTPFVMWLCCKFTQNAQDLESEAQRKAREIEELRAQEKFMKVGTGEADCLSCGYKYEPKNGDPDYPIAPGSKFQV